MRRQLELVEKKGEMVIPAFDNCHVNMVAALPDGGITMMIDDLGGTFHNMWFVVDAASSAKTGILALAIAAITNRLTTLLTHTYSIHCNKTGITKDRNWLVEPSEPPVRQDFVTMNSNNMSKGCRGSVC